MTNELSPETRAHIERRLEELKDPAKLANWQAETDELYRTDPKFAWWREMEKAIEASEQLGDGPLPYFSVQ